MKKIDLYILRKFLGTFFYAIALLLAVVIIFDVSENVDDFIDEKASLSAIVFDYYFNFIPYFFNLFSPLFTFIAVIYFTSRLAARTEIVAMLSNGISFSRLLVPYLYAALILSLLSFYLANFVIPVTNRTLIQFQDTYLRTPADKRTNNIHMQVAKGTFIYMDSYNSETLTGHKFALEKFGPRGLEMKLKSDVIRWDSTQALWVLENYYIREFQGHYESYRPGVQLDTTMLFTPADLVVEFDDILVMNFSQLREFIRKEKLKGNESVFEYEIEKHRRIANPFATLVLTLIGMALASRKVRGGIGWHLGAGIAISFLFILFMQVSTTFGIYGKLSPALAVWVPNILFGLLGIYLLKRAPK